MGNLEPIGVVPSVCFFAMQKGRPRLLYGATFFLRLGIMAVFLYHKCSYKARRKMKEANGNVVLLNTPSPALRASSPAGGEGNNGCFLPPWRGKVGEARMRGNSTGFTLIELLVVVLIIGILAAVALPQYQKAVYKSRATEAVSMLKAITEAEEVYYLANGKYTSDISELDVEVPAELRGRTIEGKFDDRYSYTCSTLRCDARIKNANMPSFQYNFKHIDSLTAGFRYCHMIDENVEKNEKAQSICQSMGKLDSTSYDADWFNGKYFLLN